MFKLVSFFGTVASATWPDCASSDLDGGKYKTVFKDLKWNSSQYYMVHPKFEANDDTKFPVVVFMHGSTAQYEMYQENLELYASHGFIVLFPFIYSPTIDKLPIALNTDGKYILKGIDYMNAINTDASVLPELHQKADMSNLIVNGHSMGATCTIAAGKRLDQGIAKAFIAQHPGLCGPFGPPPYPFTWMPADLANLMEKAPYLMSSATNDDAFLPGGQTPKSEHGCYEKSLKAMGDSNTAQNSAYVQFSTAACTEDHKHDPFDDKGHDCAFKHEVETPWVLTAMKLYAMQDGSESSQCFKDLWGNETQSLRNTKTADIAEIHDQATVTSFLQ